MYKVFLEGGVTAGHSASACAPAHINTLVVLTLAVKTFYVEVIVLDSQHLSFAFLPTSEALDDPLFHCRTWVAAVLSVQHYRSKRIS